MVEGVFAAIGLAVCLIAIVATVMGASLYLFDRIREYRADR